MIKLVLIGGGSASGKTYVISEVLKNLDPKLVTHVSIDDYYKDQSDMPFEQRIKQNYDHPKAFDWKLINSQLKDLKDGKTIEKPTYDYVNHTRAKETEIIEPKRLIIVEGIMALVNKDLRSLSDLNVFINASGERRFIRRLRRDMDERGRTYDSIVNQYFATVQPMHEEIIGPSQYYADLTINNDGYTNKSISVLTSVLRDLLEDDFQYNDVQK